MPETSVVITNRPCTLIDSFERREAHQVLEDKCTGCGACMDLGCPAITVRARAEKRDAEGQPYQATYTTIDARACTGCAMCVSACNHGAIVPLAGKPGAGSCC